MNHSGPTRFFGSGLTAFLGMVSFTVVAALFAWSLTSIGVEATPHRPSPAPSPTLAALPLPNIPWLAGNGQNNIPRPSEPQPTRAECVIATWLAPESSRIDEIVLKLHALQKLDAAAYKKEAPPAECPQQLFKYRVSILDKVVALMERK